MRLPWHRAEDENIDRMVEETLRGKRRIGEASWHGLLCALSGMGDVQPAPEASALAFQRMMLTAQELRDGHVVARTAQRPRAYSRLAAPVATCLASLLMIFGGLTAVSQAAQPGSTLYPLKRFSEQIAISSARGWDNTANVELSCATRRLDEVEKLRGQGNASREEAYIPGLVEDFNNKVDAALGLAAGREDEAGEQIRAHAEELNRRLDELEPEHDQPGTGAGEIEGGETKPVEEEAPSVTEHTESHIEDHEAPSTSTVSESPETHHDVHTSSTGTYSESSHTSPE